MRNPLRPDCLDLVTPHLLAVLRIHAATFKKPMKRTKTEMSRMNAWQDVERKSQESHAANCWWDWVLQPSEVSPLMNWVRRSPRLSIMSAQTLSISYRMPTTGA